MANLPLTFAEVLGGGVILMAGLSGKGIGDVMNGKVSLSDLSPFQGGSTPSGNTTGTSPGATTATTGKGTGLTGAGARVLQVLTGKASWFGGPHDPGAGGAPASGMGWIPGIAVYNNSTLGGYWRVTAPNGQMQVLPQIDLGPAPWTGRKVDISYNAVPLFGYSEGSFPTDQGTWKLEYLGKTKPAR